MTTAALKGIDREGGIDNYLMGLDERSVQVESITSNSLHTPIVLRSNNMSDFGRRIPITSLK